ncbi:hypothetical protein Tco_1279717 [Tanacetum coccineum]
MRKRYRATSELVEDTEDESSALDTKREGLEDEGHGLEDEGPGTEEEEEETTPEGQQQVVLVVDKATDKPLRLGYEALRRRELVVGEGEMPSTFKVRQSSRYVLEHEGAERVYAFRQPTLVTWVDPKDGRVYTDILTYEPPVAPRENHDLRRQVTEERRERLELIDHVARIERRHESIRE